MRAVHSHNLGYGAVPALCGATLAGVKGGRLPRYRFKIRWSDGRELVDDEGEVLPDDTAARDYAIRMIRELKEDGGYDEPGLTMIVIDGSGGEMFQFPFEFFH